jgi:hypothetical protein
MFPNQNLLKGQPHGQRSGRKWRKHAILISFPFGKYAVDGCDLRCVGNFCFCSSNILFSVYVGKRLAGILDLSWDRLLNEMNFLKIYVNNWEIPLHISTVSYTKITQ